MADLSDLEGRWLVVNYWADWCPPCIKEMPELTSFYNDNKEEVLVLAFNFDELRRGRARRTDYKV